MNSAIRKLSLSLITHEYEIDSFTHRYYLRDFPSRDCKLYIHDNTQYTPYLRDAACAYDFAYDSEIISRETMPALFSYSEKHRLQIMIVIGMQTKSGCIGFSRYRLTIGSILFLRETEGVKKARREIRV